MVFDKVKSILSDQFDVEESLVTKDTTFDELGADSLDVTELIMALEEAFGVEIPDEAVANLCTVGDLVEFLDAKV